MSTLHRDDTKTVGYEYPLPTTASYDADLSFNANILTNNATTALTVKAGTSGKYIHITDLVISSPATNRVDLEDGDGTNLGTYYVGASSPFERSYVTPKRVTLSKNLMVKSATAVNLAVEVHGYIK